MFIRFSSLGDIILNSSLFGLIKKKFGGSVSLTLLTSSQFAPLMEDSKELDQVYGFSRKEGLGSLYKFVNEIHKEKKIDLIIDLHGTLRSIFIRFAFFFIPRVFVDKRSIERWILTTLKFDLLSMQNNKNDNRSGNKGELLLKRNPRDFFYLLGCDEDNLNEYKSSGGRLSTCSFTDSQETSTRFNELGKYIAIVPSASFPEKRWSAENFKILCKKLLETTFYKIVITAGPDDNFCDVFNEIGEVFPKRFHNLQGKTNLPETIELVKNANLVIGNDTGVPHFSESVGTPCLFILGPTGEEFGFYPHLNKSKIVSKDLWCRPCTTNGKGNCIRSERFCLTEISVDEVLETAIEMLNDH